jgi:hypothetical protein
VDLKTYDLRKGPLDVAEGLRGNPGIKVLEDLPTLLPHHDYAAPYAGFAGRAR